MLSVGQIFQHAFSLPVQAVESDHTDAANVQTVARILAGLVTAAESDVGSLTGQLEAGSCHEARFLFSPNRSFTVKEAASDSIQHEVGIPKLYMLGTEFRAADFHQAVESEHTDDANVETVARILAGLVTSAESDVGSQEAVLSFGMLARSGPRRLVVKEAASDGIQHEVGQTTFLQSWFVWCRT